MKGKTLLGSLVVSLCLVVRYQVQMKPIVSAETKESVSLQHETLSSTEAGEVSEEPLISTVSSSIEEIRSSESSVAEEIDNSTVETSTVESVVEESVEAEPVSPPEAASQIQSPISAAKVEENYQFSVVKNQTTNEFIQSIGTDAQRIAWDEGLYASVMIAQAILETGSSNSQLARPPHHNLFGIKGSYQGKNVSFSTQEDKGNGQLYTIQSAFRQYPSYKESLEDYAALLKKGISGNAGFYQATWKANAATYREATSALTGKYATDTSYDKKLNALIETYELTRFDCEPGKEEATESSELVETPESTETVNDRTSTSTEVSSESEEKKTRIDKTKQQAVMIPPTAQRPAKQLFGNRTAQ